jgi:diguanylate cyclase (GGDEF)-like protein
VANGLYADSIQQILIDKAGMFWIGSSRGVFRVRGQELNNVLDGRARYVHCVPLSADEGGTGGPTRAPFQPSCLVGRDGSFWFCTWAGLLRIAHDGVQMPTDATLRLPTVIEHVQIDNRTYNPAVRVIAPPGNGRLRIDYAALGYSRPGKVIFRYMLSGIDPEWVDAGSQRFLYYTTLAPGDYVLRIRALDRDNFVRYTEATLTFRILPHFYQTTAFRLLVIFCAVIVGILFHLWRTAALRRRSAELEICVTERTQELIEAVGQLQELSDELMVQNDSLQAMQSEMEMQNEELAAARATLESQNHILSQLATTDALTGIANRRAFLEKLQQERSACSQKGEPLSLLLIDVDKFKNYNDTYGHPAGDEVLKKVAKLLQQEARQDDCVARYGGEEFVVLLPNTTQEKAIGVAERMRRAIEASEWTNLNVTASFGVATMCNVEMPMELLVEEADQALYESKRAGRNRCTHYRQLGLSAVAEAQKAA